MVSLTYWEQFAAESSKHGRTVHVWPADLQRLVAYAVSLEEHNAYLSTELRRLERAQWKTGDR